MIRSSLFAILVVSSLPDAVGAQTAFPVEIVTVHAAPRVLENRLVGRIEAANSYPGAFRAGGRIVEIAVETGDRVAGGTVMARIDDTQPQAALAGARAGLDATQAALRQAEQARDRARSLLQRGVGTQSQLDTADEAWLAARASRDQAAARLSSAEQALEDTVIRAREDLVVLDRFANPGEIIGAGGEVLSLATEDRLEALFLSPDMVGLGDMRSEPAELRPDGQAPIVTRITEISPVLTATGTVEVRAEIPADVARSLTIGDTLEGEIRSQTAPVFTVPWTALTATSAGPAVWTVNPTTMAVHLTLISIDGYEDFSVDIAAGLDDGALVVGAGSQALYEGMIVAPAGGTE
jgi:membrane fusion protein, multidrug efflux system